MKRLSGLVVLLTVFVLTLPLVTPRIRGADEIEYFSYLRSLAFDRDLDFTNEYLHFVGRDAQGLAAFSATFLERREPLTGRPLNFGPLGSALLWSPFYGIAHAGVILARLLGSAVPADGFSWPYEAAACYASALYGLLGLLLARDVLVRFAGMGDAPATASVLTLWLGSPVLYYMTLAPAFSHATSLFAVSLLVWTSLSTGRGRPGSLGRWLGLGLLGGLAGLVREQDVLFLVVPAGLLVADLRERRDLRAFLARGAALAAGAFAGFAPQLLAYRALNGTFAPSRLVARKMTYWSPHFLEVLFDPGHGLFAWSPVLLVAVAGLGLSLRSGRSGDGRLLALAVLLQVWINGAVESWTQAGAFGSRRFVGCTVAFAWGLGHLLQRFAPRFGRPGRAAVVLLFAWWNTSLMVQFGLRLMDRQRLQWPAVAVNQVTEVPRRLGRTAWLFFADREQLIREGR